MTDNCTCIALGHDHAPLNGRTPEGMSYTRPPCQRKPVTMFGICHECHYWVLGNPPKEGL